MVWQLVDQINRNGEITTYEVRYTPLEDFEGQIQTEFVNVTSPIQNANLISLQAYVNYSVSVRAYTAIGPGPYSTAEIELTRQDGKQIQYKQT